MQQQGLLDGFVYFDFQFPLHALFTWQHAASKLVYLAQSSAISCRSSICQGRLYTAWLVSFVVFSCSMVSTWWHARSFSRLWGGWCALSRTTSFFSHCWLWLLLLFSPWPRCRPFCSCLWYVEHTSFHCVAASLFCAHLVDVHISAPDVIADSTQELYICLFRQMAAQPAMILRCISLSRFFALPWCCSALPSRSYRPYVAFNIFYQYVIHVDWDDFRLIFVQT